jgi:hypothetical protein
MCEHLVLGPEALIIVCRAYDEVVRRVFASMPPGGITLASRRVVASRILEAARRGERNELRLIWAGMGRSLGPNSLEPTPLPLRSLPLG